MAISEKDCTFNAFRSMSSREQLTLGDPWAMSGNFSVTPNRTQGCHKLFMRAVATNDTVIGGWILKAGRGTQTDVLILIGVAAYASQQKPRNYTILCVWPWPALPEQRGRLVTSGRPNRKNRPIRKSERQELEAAETNTDAPITTNESFEWRPCFDSIDLQENGYWRHTDKESTQTIDELFIDYYSRRNNWSYCPSH